MTRITSFQRAERKQEHVDSDSVQFDCRGHGIDRGRNRPRHRSNKSVNQLDGILIVFLCCAVVRMGSCSPPHRTQARENQRARDLNSPGHH